MGTEIIAILNISGKEIPLEKGESTNYRKPLDELLDYGLSCRTCYFRDYDMCACEAKNALRFRNSKVLYLSDFLKRCEYENELDKRNICEFYKTTAKPFRKIREISGDYAFSFCEYDKNLKRIVYKRIDSYTEALMCEVQKLQEDLKNEEKKHASMSEIAMNKHSENLQIKEFLDFIKSELPEVYTKLRKEFKKRKGSMK